MKRAWLMLVAVGIVAGSLEAQAAWPWKSTSTSVPISRTTGTPLLNGKPVFTSSKGPSTWDKISSGTKKVASGTVDVITLKPVRNWWSADKKPTVKAPPIRSSSGKTGFGSWFKPKEEKKIQTVGDWMAQPQPKL